MLCDKGFFPLFPLFSFYLCKAYGTIFWIFIQNANNPTYLRAQIFFCLCDTIGCSSPLYLSNSFGSLLKVCNWISVVQDLATAVPNLEATGIDLLSVSANNFDICICERKHCFYNVKFKTSSIVLLFELYFYEKKKIYKHAGHYMQQCAFHLDRSMIAPQLSLVLKATFLIFLVVGPF